MSACHDSGGRGPLVDWVSEDGGASSTSIADPHFLITQSGASRSVSPATLRTERRFLDARNRGSDSWYLSGKMCDGRVR